MMIHGRRRRHTAAGPALAAALVLAIAGGRAAAQEPSCTCAGLGEVTLADRGGSPIAFRSTGAPEGPAIAAQIRLSCAMAGSGDNRCEAEVDVTISGQGESRAGSGSGSATAPADACLVLGEALAQAWQEAAGTAGAANAPGPCS